MSIEQLEKLNVDPGTFLMEYEGAELLNRFNLPVAKSKLATTKEEAVQFAKEIGYPVVMKGMSRDIVHKTDAGVVKVNVQTEDELKKAYEEIVENAYKYNPAAKLAGSSFKRWHQREQS